MLHNLFYPKYSMYQMQQIDLCIINNAMYQGR